MTIKMTCICLDDGQKFVHKRAKEFTLEGVDYFIEDDVRDGEVIATAENKLEKELPILCDSLANASHPNTPYHPNEYLIDHVKILIEGEELDLDNPGTSLLEILTKKVLDEAEAELIAESEPEEELVDEGKEIDPEFLDTLKENFESEEG
jgi:hypothetical protein